MNKSDIKETTVNMVLGLVINNLLTILMFGVSFNFAIGTSCIFFIVSFIRSYAVRSYYRKKEEKEKLND